MGWGPCTREHRLRGVREGSWEGVPENGRVFREAEKVEGFTYGSNIMSKGER